MQNSPFMPPLLFSGLLRKGTYLSDQILVAHAMVSRQRIVTEIKHANAAHSGLCDFLHYLQGIHLRDLLQCAVVQEEAI